MCTPPARRTIKLAAVADLHCPRTPAGVLNSVLTQIAANADLVALCGDLTDHGLPEEARILARELTSVVKIPIVAVLGNHDYESGKQDEVKSILMDAGVRVLDGDTCDVQGVSFAGVKGFAGGFGRHVLQPWGEASIKQFVREAVEEALKFESALARLHGSRRVALLHYAPIQATVEGEPLEILPFLGSSRFEEPLLRNPVQLVFHGHAHGGSAEGRTRDNIPVFNVSLQLLQRLHPSSAPFRMVEIPMDGEGAAPPLKP